MPKGFGAAASKLCYDQP